MQVNVVLEYKREKNVLSPRRIGTIYVASKETTQLSLDNLRRQIIKRFDNNQMRLLGGVDFQFLNQGIPVSRKQEKQLTSYDIALTLNLVTSIGQTTKRKDSSLKSLHQSIHGTTTQDVSNFYSSFNPQSGLNIAITDPKEEEEEEQKNKKKRRR